MSLPTRRPPVDRDSDRPIYDMELPFDPNNLRRNARAHGLDRLGAAVFAHLALQEVRSLHETNDGEPLTVLQLAEAIKKKATEEVERGKRAQAAMEKASQEDIEQRGISWEDMELDADPIDLLRKMDTITLEEDVTDGMRRKRFKFSEDGLEEHFGNVVDPYAMPDETALSLKYNGCDLVSGICHNVELAVELGKYLGAEDIFHLYQANRGFYNAVNCYLLSSVRTWIAHNAPEAGRIFNYKLYRRHLVFDPTGRTWKGQREGTGVRGPGKDVNVRSVPGLKYLQLVMGRHRYCKEIIAMMARSGHRMPPTMFQTLLRLWLLMDVSTSVQRQALLRTKSLYTDVDIYNVQFFLMKLGLHFNDPVYGPSSWDLVQLMMGQRGLYPLWQLLTRKRLTRLSEIMELKLRYDFEVPDDHWGKDYFDKTIHGVPYSEVGIGHLEGWGLGDDHLLRPDELIPVEAIERGLDLDEHLTHMMVWGYFDWKTGENIVPSEEEMHIDNEEKVIGHMDTSGHWRRRHVLKKRWHELAPEQQQEIKDDDEDERLRAMAWCGDTIDDYNYDSEEGYGDHRPYTLDDEIRRGFIVPPQPKDHASQVPDVDNKEGWVDFVNQAIMGIAPDVSEDEKLRSEAWQSYNKGDTDHDWDWGEWLEQELARKQAATGGASLASSDGSDRTDETEIATRENFEYGYDGDEEDGQSAGEAEEDESDDDETDDE